MIYLLTGACMEGLDPTCDVGYIDWKDPSVQGPPKQDLIPTHCAYHSHPQTSKCMYWYYMGSFTEWGIPGYSGPFEIGGIWRQSTCSKQIWYICLLGGHGTQWPLIFIGGILKNLDCLWLSKSAYWGCVWDQSSGGPFEVGGFWG